MKHLILTVFFGLVSCLPTMAQTNPCSAPGSLTVVTSSPSKVFVEHAGFLATAPDGSRIVQNVTIAAFTPGTDLTQPSATPVAQQVLASALFTAVAGAPNCYTATLPQPLAVPVNQQFTSAARASNTGGNSPWTAGNPFFVLGAPSAFSNVRAQ